MSLALNHLFSFPVVIFFRDLFNQTLINIVVMAYFNEEISINDSKEINNVFVCTAKDIFSLFVECKQDLHLIGSVVLAIADYNK